MPKAIPAAVIIEKNKRANAAAWLALLDITLPTVDASTTAIAQWKLNDSAANTTVADAIGSHTGTASSNTDTFDATGKINTCFDFGGVESILVADHADHSFGDEVEDQPFWVKAWVFVTATAVEQIILSKYDAAAAGGKEWDLRITAAEKLQLNLYDNASGVWINSTTDDALVTDAWNYVVATYDGSGSNGGINLYVNAHRPDQTRSSNGTYTAMHATAADVYIGARYNADTPGTELIFQDKIDNVAIGSGELDLSVIRAFYNDAAGTESLSYGGDVFRVVRNNEDVDYDGNTYTASNFNIEKITQDHTGKIQAVVLKIQNVSQFLVPFLKRLDGAIGTTVVLTVISSGLAGEDFSFTQLTFSVIAAQHNAQVVTFSLGGPDPLRQRFPNRKYTALHCQFEFKSAECGYTGAKTACDRTLVACRIRANQVRIGAFVGLRQGTIRVAS